MINYQRRNALTLMLRLLSAIQDGLSLLISLESPSLE